MGTPNIQILANIASSGIADLAAACGIPGSNLIGASLQSASQIYLEKKAAERRAIILEELSSDKIAPWQIGSDDATLGAIYKFQRASIEGASKHNLRLIARALRNTVLAGDITADRFNLFSDILANLSRAECILLGKLHRICREKRAQHGTTQDGPGSEEMWETLCAATIPEQYSDKRRLTTALMALQRTGLVMPLTTIDLALTGYESSPLMDELQEIIGDELLDDLEGGV